MKIAQGTTYRPVTLDYVLAGFSGALALFTTGMGISAPVVGQIFAGVAILGTLASWFAQRWLKPAFLDRFGGIPYVVALVGTAFAARSLGTLLPENPFEPRELLVSGILCWMIVVGSFFAWTEGTMLFQAVPCIALFGLVGVYDTYRNAVYAFFAFMLCFAMQFSRSHARSMLRQAASAGYGPRSIEHGTRTAPTFEDMLAGPWRWAAGPGWALASAGVVIILSWIGAPVLQESMKGVAGVVRVSVPQSIRRNLPRGFDTSPDQTRVGLGPVSLSDDPVLRVELDRPRYLRASVFQSYTGRGWRSSSSDIVRSAKQGLLKPTRLSMRTITDRMEVPYSVEVLDPRIQAIPVPGEVTAIDQPDAVSIRTDGTLIFTNRDLRPVITGRTVVPREGQPRDSVQDLPPGYEALVTPGDISPEIQQLARDVTRGLDTDYDRALAIKREIERRCKYNLQAAAAPAEADPVTYFLFESRQGYCDLFASSMVLMARSIGLPARYVTGYFPIRGQRDSSGRFIISEAEGHAWAELFFEGKGWIPFDATEGAQQVEGGERGRSNESGSLVASIGERTLDVAIVLLVLAAGYFLVRSFGRRKPIEQQRKSALDREFVRFARAVAAHTGVRRHLHQTPREYVDAVRGRLGEVYEPASELVAFFEQGFYSPRGPGDADLEVIRSQSTAVQTALKKRPKTAAVSR